MRDRRSGWLRLYSYIAIACMLIAASRVHAVDASPNMAQLTGQALSVDAVEASYLPPRYTLERTPFFRNLVAARDAYRKLASEGEPAGKPPVHPAWSEPLPPLPGKKVSPGDPYSGVVTLARRLIALGDLSTTAALPPLYEGVLVDAVRRFQARHGLTVDGIVGPTTLRELNVTPAQRLAQIERNLKRLRNTPPFRGERAVVVNLPEFALRLYQQQENEWHELAHMRVIVGKAYDTDTPLFDEDIAYIEFHPYWNIPRSIARRETIPRLQRDPGYFQRMGLEFVTADGRVERHLTDALMQAVIEGGARLRQRPGPMNAMGDIKFILPNNSSIYLHHTPSVGLFERSRRDFSHGCIRVENPVPLAEFVLADPVRWSADQVIEAMRAGKTRTVRLPVPVQVMVIYSTVAVNEGVVHFYPDVYGHDAKGTASERTRSSGTATPAPTVPAAPQNVDIPSVWRLRSTEPTIVH